MRLRGSVKTSWGRLFRAFGAAGSVYRLRVLMLLAVTGINAVIYYGTDIFTFGGLVNRRRRLMQPADYDAERGSDGAGMC